MRRDWKLWAAINVSGVGKRGASIAIAPRDVVREHHDVLEVSVDVEKDGYARQEHLQLPLHHVRRVLPPVAHESGR